MGMYATGTTGTAFVTNNDVMALRGVEPEHLCLAIAIWVLWCCRMREEVTLDATSTARRISSPRLLKLAKFDALPQQGS
jgi:hypothetical protein